MTNQEAYNLDLDYLMSSINSLLAAVPVGKTRSEAHRREEADRVASLARATIQCMRNDYIIDDC